MKTRFSLVATILPVPFALITPTAAKAGEMPKIAKVEVMANPVCRRVKRRHYSTYDSTTGTYFAGHEGLHVRYVGLAAFTFIHSRVRAVVRSVRRIEALLRIILLGLCATQLAACIAAYAMACLRNTWPQPK